MKSISMYFLVILFTNSINAQNSFVYKIDNLYNLQSKVLLKNQYTMQKPSAVTLPEKKITHFFGVNFVGGGPSGLTSISLDYHPIRRISFEIGYEPTIFFSSSYYGGLKYFFKDDLKKATPFIGVYRLKQKLNNGILSSQKETINGFYFPVGIQTINANSWSFTMEIAGITRDHKDNIGLWGAIKIGYYFFYKGE